MRFLNGLPSNAARYHLMPLPQPVLRQSGVIPYRFCDDRMEVLLVTNRGGNRWLVPKGHVEPDMTAHHSAAKEAFEEAGVLGVVGDRRLGSFAYAKNGSPRIVDLFPLRVTHTLDEWPEAADRRRRWTSIDRAALLVRFPGLCGCLRSIRGLLAHQAAA